MKKIFFIILLALILFNLESLDFDVQSFSLDKNDLHGLVYPEYDSNGEFCSLIRIETDAEEDIYLSDIEVIKKEKKAKGIYYFYLSHREKRFSILSKDYMPYDYNISAISLQPSKVYILKIKTKGKQINNLNRRLSIDFFLNEKPDSIFVDNELILKESIDLGNKFLLSLSVNEGEHEIKLVKTGFRNIIIRDFFNTNENVPKDFEELIGDVVILTIPDNVHIEIENKQIGYTPINNFQIKPGEYELTMNYMNNKFSVLISIKDGENKFVYNMDDYFSTTLNIATSPSGFPIFIDNIEIGVTPINSNDNTFTIGEHELVIKNFIKEDLSTMIDIKSKNNNYFFFNQSDYLANLIINTIPKKVQVYLEDECIGASPIIMNKLPIKSYLFKFAYQSYKLPYNIDLDSGDNVININIKDDLLSTLEVKSDRNCKLLIYGKKYNIDKMTTIVKNKFVPGDYKYGIYILLNEHNKDKKLTPFYKEIKICEENINLKPGINIIEQKLLEDEITTLNINTSRPSKIYLNKNFIGNNNQTIELEPGKYNLLIKYKNSKERVEETIELLPGVNDINY